MAAPVPPVLCKPLLRLTRRAVSVRAAPPRQQQHRARPRPPPRNEPARRPPRVPLDQDDYEYDDREEGRFAGGTRAAAMPKPPAGFVLDDQGRCIAAASKRIVAIIDDANNRPLECIIRRVFRSSQDHDCMLLCPVDMPVQVLKSTNFSGWVAVDDDQLKQIIPSVAYALARVHMHFVESGFCYTARGGFCFPEEAIQEFHVKDKDGVLRIADDDLMEDPAVLDAVDEETEFTALVEEEEALLETVLGER